MNYIPICLVAKNSQNPNHFQPESWRNSRFELRKAGPMPESNGSDNCWCWRCGKMHLFANTWRTVATTKPSEEWETHGKHSIFLNAISPFRNGFCFWIVFQVYSIMLQMMGICIYEIKILWHENVGESAEHCVDKPRGLDDTRCPLQLISFHHTRWGF